MVGVYIYGTLFTPETILIFAFFRPGYVMISISNILVN